MEKSLRNDNYFLRNDDSLSDKGPCQSTTNDKSRLISNQFEQILDSLPFYVLLVDSSHHIQFANQAFRASFNKNLSEVQGAYCPQLVHNCNHYEGCAVEQAIKDGFTEKIHFNEAYSKWLLTTAYPTGAKTQEGLELYYHSVRDITEERKAQEALKASEHRYRRLFEEIKDVVFVISSDGTLQNMNPAGLELLQIQPHKLGKINLCTDLNLDAIEYESFLNNIRNKGSVIEYEISFVRPDGKMIVGSINASIERHCSGEDTIRGIMRDLTRNRELEELSTVDTLTGLYNRGFFQTFLINRVRNIRFGQEESLSLLFFDIDNFKSYNDTYGHLEGDYALKKVADAIKAAIRVEDVAARYGGEEFAVILTCEIALAKLIAERIRRTIEESCSDFADTRIKRGITVSIGLSTFGVDADSAERLVKVADQRMYEAKKRGKNCVFFS